MGIVGISSPGSGGFLSSGIGGFLSSGIGRFVSSGNGEFLNLEVSLDLLPSGYQVWFSLHCFIPIHFSSAVQGLPYFNSLIPHTGLYKLEVYDEAQSSQLERIPIGSQ